MAIIGISGKIGSGKDTIGTIIQVLTDDNLTDGEVFEIIEGRLALTPGTETWEIKKFAGKLKQITALLLGCTVEQLEDRDFKEKELGEEWARYKVVEMVGDLDRIYEDVYFVDEQDAISYMEEDSEMRHYPEKEILTPRKLLQLLGTEAGRDIIHPNIWVNALFADYKEVKKYHKNNAKSLLKEGYAYKELPNWIITDVRFLNEAQAIKDRGGYLIRINRGDGNTGDHPSETALDNYTDWDFTIDNNGTIDQLLDKVKAILTKLEIL